MGKGQENSCWGRYCDRKSNKKARKPKNTRTDWRNCRSRLADFVTRVYTLGEKLGPTSTVPRQPGGEQTRRRQARPELDAGLVGKSPTTKSGGGHAQVSQV